MKFLLSYDITARHDDVRDSLLANKFEATLKLKGKIVNLPETTLITQKYKSALDIIEFFISLINSLNAPIEDDIPSTSEKIEVKQQTIPEQIQITRMVVSMILDSDGLPGKPYAKNSNG